MAKYYRGDTLPIVASYEGYTFKEGDIITCAIFEAVDTETADLGEALATITTTVLSSADEVQLEFSREQMHDIAGEVIIEVRTVSGNTEMTIQKTLDLRRDGIR